MVKYILFLTVLVFTLSCGKKSEIKNAVKAETFAQRYGDGKYATLPLVLPLSDEAIDQFDNPLAKINFLARGFAKMLYNLGASMGMGKLKMSMVQPLPEIPEEYIKEIRIKRIFFYIEPVDKNPDMTRRERIASWFEKTFKGKSDVNFNFLEKLALKISSTKVKETDSWYPQGFEVTDLKRNEYTPMQRLFERESDIDTERVIEDDLEESNNVIMLKYSDKNPSHYLRNSKSGQVYLLTATDPLKTKDYLEKSGKFDGFFQRIHILNKSVLVELKKDPMTNELFKNIISEEADHLEELGGIKIIEPCSEQTCLDFKLPKEDLLPLIKKGSGLRIDAFMVADKVPDSFQLKGFIELEIKLNLMF